MMMDRLWVKLLLYPAIGVGTFFIIFWMALPMDKVKSIAKGKMEAALGHEYNVDMASLELSGLSGVVVTDLSISSKPPPLDLSEEERAKIKRVAMNIDRIEVDLALFKSLTGEIEADFEVDLGGGKIVGSYGQQAYEPVKTKTLGRRPTRPPVGRGKGKGKDKGKDKDKDKDKDNAEKGPDAEDEEAKLSGKELMGHKVTARFDEVPLNSITIIRSMVGLPVTGSIDGELEVVVGQASELVDGKINLTIKRTTLGPGQLPPDVAMGFKLENLVKIGDINIDTQVQEGGKFIIDSIASTGPDMVLQSNGNITMRQPSSLSRVRVNLRFKLDAGFLKTNKLQGILDLDPKVRSGKSGQWYGLLIDGTIGRLNYRFSAPTAAKFDRIKPN